jgi:hypothetical protein
MPVHDWTNVTSGIFHHFHQSWSIEITKALNGGVLPPGFSAMADQRAGGKIPDVLTLQSHSRTSNPRPERNGGGVLTLDPPATKLIKFQTPSSIYARRANRLTIRHQLGRVVAVIELVSPGNKESKKELKLFVEKSADFLVRGIHVLIVDLFPPTPRDPGGLHKAIMEELGDEEPYTLPADKPFTLVSYQVGDEQTAARIHHIGVGDSLPDMPIYLTADEFVMVPLEATYRETWKTCPEVMRVAVETGVMPDFEAEE